MAESLKPGKQLLNHMVDDLARLTPSATWAETPISTTSYEPGFRKITYRMLANAVNGVAWWMHQSLGPGHDFETLAYFGPWDIRYVLLLLGAVKAGYKVSIPLEQSIFVAASWNVAELAVHVDGLSLIWIQYCRAGCSFRWIALRDHTCAVNESKNCADIPRSSSAQNSERSGD